MFSWFTDKSGSLEVLYYMFSWFTDNSGHQKYCTTCSVGSQITVVTRRTVLHVHFTDNSGSLEVLYYMFSWFTDNSGHQKAVLHVQFTDNSGSLEVLYYIFSWFRDNSVPVGLYYMFIWFTHNRCSQERLKYIFCLFTNHISNRYFKYSTQESVQKQKCYVRTPRKLLIYTCHSVT